jgi:hypothetical protein
MAIGKSKLHELLRRGKLLNDAVAWYEAFSPRTKTQILDLVRQEQLMKKGIDGTGKVIGYYSMLTSRINPKKKFNTPYTLYDTGAFYRSMYVRVLMESIEIDADTQKMEDKKWYTTKILTLTDENLTILQRTIKEAYITYFRKILAVNQ